MTVGVIGTGFVGLAAAYKLSQKGIKVYLFESEEQAGGLALGFPKENWDWDLEKFYHHLFVSDYSILDLAKSVNHPILFSQPKSSTFTHGKIYQLDTPTSLIKFKLLPLIDRIRLGVFLACLKLMPYSTVLETITTKNLIYKFSGKRSWELIWEPLMKKKFGDYSDQIAASWFWARVKKRSKSLGYPEGGFKSLVKTVEKEIKKNKGEFFFNTRVTNIKKTGNKISITSTAGKKNVDKVICTLPTYLFMNIVSDLPASFKEKYQKLNGLGAINLILSLNNKFLNDNTYWLNINELDFPFLAVVEQTNFIDKNKYDNQHIIYVGNYLSQNHKYFKHDDKKLLTEFMPYLKKINKKFNKKWINKYWVFKAPFAQPIIYKNYSHLIPPIKTPIKNIYLANIEQVYPWDRGTNYAVELGNKVAEMII